MANFTPHQEVNDFLNQWLPKISGKHQSYNYCLKHFDKNTQVNVLAIGKASVAMTLGVLNYFNKPPKQLLCISKKNHNNQEFLAYLAQYTHWQYIESSHPVINQSSLDAGDKLIHFLEYLNPNIPLLCLISGGTSSLVEKLPFGISLDFLMQLNQYLLSSGLSIKEINQIRKQFSLIKDGRLLPYINAKKTDVLYLSDVPNNDVSVIGSGLFKKAPVTKLPPIPKQFNVALPVFNRKELVKKKVYHHVIFDLDKAIQLAANLLPKNKVYVHPQLLFEPLSNTKATITKVLSNQPEFDVYLFGGEPTVTLPKNAGKGGRNQHLALSFVDDTLNQPLIIVCIGTDGTDGTTNLAGAWVDESLLQYKKEVNAVLKKANSYAFVKKQSLGINTGATGTNVMDVVIVFRKNK